MFYAFIAALDEDDREPDLQDMVKDYKKFAVRKAEKKKKA